MHRLMLARASSAPTVAMTRTVCPWSSREQGTRLTGIARFIDSFLFGYSERTAHSAGKWETLMDTYDTEFEMSMYDDMTPAEAAIARLHELGYERDDIGVMMDDKTRERAFAAYTTAKTGEGLATGGVVGGVLG